MQTALANARSGSGNRFRNFISAKSPISWKPEKVALSTRIRRKCSSSSRMKWHRTVRMISPCETNRMRRPLFSPIARRTASTPRDCTCAIVSPPGVGIVERMIAIAAGSRHPRASRRTPSLPSAHIGLRDSCGSSAIGDAADAGRDYLRRLPRARQRTRDDQLGFEQARERDRRLRPARVRSASSSTGLRPITRPSRFHAVSP